MSRNIFALGLTVLTFASCNQTSPQKTATGTNSAGASSASDCYARYQDYNSYTGQCTPCPYGFSSVTNSCQTSNNNNNNSNYNNNYNSTNYPSVNLTDNGCFLYNGSQTIQVNYSNQNNSYSSTPDYISVSMNSVSSNVTNGTMFSPFANDTYNRTSNSNSYQYEFKSQTRDSLLTLTTSNRTVTLNGQTFTLQSCANMNVNGMNGIYNSNGGVTNNGLSFDANTIINGISTLSTIFNGNRTTQGVQCPAAYYAPQPYGASVECFAMSANTANVNGQSVTSYSRSSNTPAPRACCAGLQ